MILADKFGQLRVSQHMRKRVVAKRLDLIPDQNRTVQESPLCLYEMVKRGRYHPNYNTRNTAFANNINPG